MKMNRHHLLEIILWPNPDGSFREIRNSVARLKELGIYDEYKMCIEISASDHAKLHQKGKNNANYRGDDATEATKKRRHCNSRDPELRRLRRAKRKSAAQLRAADEVRPN